MTWRQSLRIYHIVQPNESNTISQEQFVIYAPPPSFLSWKLRTLSRTHILAHSQVRRRLRVRPGPMAHRVALSYFYPAGQWRTSPRLTWRLSVRSLSSQRSIPASAGITKDLTSTESDVHCPHRGRPGDIFTRTAPPLRWSRLSRWGWPAPCFRKTLFSPPVSERRETQRTSNAQNLLKWIVSVDVMFFFSYVLIDSFITKSVKTVFCIIC